MPSAGASSFPATSRAKSSTSTAAASARHSPTACCRDPKADCSPGSPSAAFSTVILVEGLFDLAVLWQAGFRNTTCAIGTQLTAAQITQLTDQPGRSVYIAFDQDDNQAGQKACPPASPAPRERRPSALTSSGCQTGMIPTATSSPAPPPPTSPPVCEQAQQL